MNSQRVLWLTPSIRLTGEASPGEVPASALRERVQLPLPLDPVQRHSTSPLPADTRLRSTSSSSTQWFRVG